MASIDFQNSVRPLKREFERMIKGNEKQYSNRLAFICARCKLGKGTMLLRREMFNMLPEKVVMEILLLSVSRGVAMRLTGVKPPEQLDELLRLALPASTINSMLQI